MKKASALDEFTGGSVVSLDRVDRFADLSRAEQLEVLTTLRGRGMEDNFELPLFAIVVPIVTALAVGLMDVKPLAGPLWADLIALALMGFVLGIVLGAPIAIPLLRREARRKSALALLAAYEDELVRRRAMGGREGRRWRKAH
jgi:hypothetical protein